MIIKKIIPYRNDLSRVVIYFYDKSYITVDALEASRLGLKPDCEISGDVLPALTEKSRQSTAKTTAVRIVGRRTMSRAELLTKLRDKGISDEDAIKAAEWLTTLDVLDDEQYAGQVTRHYISKGYGATRIKSELMRRGLDKQLAKESIEDLPDMAEEIDRFISVKLRGKKPEKADMKRISDALSRRGHSWDDIKAGFRRIEADTEEFD